jgi:hypothetical protein
MILPTEGAKLLTYAWTFPDVTLPFYGYGLWETCSTPAVSGSVVRIIVQQIPQPLGVPRGWWWGRYYRRKRTVVDWRVPIAATFEAKAFVGPLDAAVFTPIAFGLHIRDWHIERGRAEVIRFQGNGRWRLTALVESP